MTDSNDWFQKSINSLSLNGKAERTQEAYTRALRMLCEFHGNKSPEAISEPELEAYFCTARMSMVGRPTPCVSVTAGFVSTSSKFCRGTGSFSTTCEREANRGFRPFSRKTKCAQFSRTCIPPTTAPSSPPSTPAGCVCRRPSIWKSPTSIRNA